MFCKRCGAGLPSHGYICKKCGAMMDAEQIKSQKEFQEEQKRNNHEIKFISDEYRRTPLNRNYEKREENKILGAIIIFSILLILIIIALLTH